MDSSSFDVSFLRVSSTCMMFRIQNISYSCLSPCRHDPINRSLHSHGLETSFFLNRRGRVSSLSPELYLPFSSVTSRPDWLRHRYCLRLFRDRFYIAMHAAVLSLGNLVRQKWNRVPRLVRRPFASGSSGYRVAHLPGLQLLSRRIHHCELLVGQPPRQSVGRFHPPENDKTFPPHSNRLPHKRAHSRVNYCQFSLLIVFLLLLI